MERRPSFSAHFLSWCFIFLIVGIFTVVGNILLNLDQENVEEIQDGTQRPLPE